MTRTVIRTALATALSLSAATVAAAQQTVRAAVASGSTLWIDGTSNLHDWTCRTDKLDANISLDSASITQLRDAESSALKRVVVSVPVRSLKCGHGAMDDNLYKALRADANPDVVFTLGRFDATPTANADTIILHTVGTLAVSGKANPVSMTVNAVRGSDGTISASGQLAIKMSEYGIKPPTAILGTLRTADAVTIHFQLTVGGTVVAARNHDP